MRYTRAVDGERVVAPAVNGDHVPPDKPGHHPRHPEVAVAVAAPIPHQVGARHNCTRRGERGEEGAGVKEG